MKKLTISLFSIMLLGFGSVVHAEESIPQKEGYYLDFHDEFN